MLFDRNIEPRCAYCKRGELMDEEHIICVKKGVVSPAGACRAFRYDPLKRVPLKPAAPGFERFKDEDFSL